MEKNDIETIIQDNKVTYKRHFDVPVDLAFEAWSKPEHLSQWWGPDGFTITTHKMDFSKGGHWEFIMHGPDGHDYKNKVHFLEILDSKFIGYKHMGDGEGDMDVDFEASILFEAAGEGCNLTFVQVFQSKAELERINAKYGAIEGAKQHIGNFGKFLQTLKGGSHA